VLDFINRWNSNSSEAGGGQESAGEKGSNSMTTIKGVEKEGRVKKEVNQQGPLQPIKGVAFLPCFCGTVKKGGLFL